MIVTLSETQRGGVKPKDLLSLMLPRRSGGKQVRRLRTACFAQDDHSWGIPCRDTCARTHGIR